MRRAEREITDKQEIFDVLRRCDTLRIAMQDEAAPYIVPVSFGLEIVDGQAVVYFHCAQAGRKLDLMRAHPPRMCGGRRLSGRRKNGARHHYAL